MRVRSETTKAQRPPNGTKWSESLQGVTEPRSGEGVTSWVSNLRKFFDIVVAENCLCLGARFFAFFFSKKEVGHFYWEVLNKINVILIMAKLIGMKIILALIAIGLGCWNYFLRDSVNLPVLSGLSSAMVWIIAGIFLAVTIIINWTIKD